jgi:hypothetical protein
MWQAVRRHPVPMRTRFGHSLVLAYALPPPLLAPLLPPGLALDTYRDPAGTEHGFVAVGIVSAQALRPAGLPARFGRDAVLTGYRIMARLRTPTGRTLRGLYVLRSDTDRTLLLLAGNLLTRYRYRPARISLRVAGTGPDATGPDATGPDATGLDATGLDATVHSRDGRADLAVTADLAGRPAPLPPGSPFATAAHARRFAGPLPYTFDAEPRTRSIVVVKASRTAWRPEPVGVEVHRLTFFRHGPFAGSRPVLANAFHVAGVDYGWQRGVRYPAGDQC